MALEGALVGYAVTKLLDKVLEAVTLVVDRNKNCEALRRLLQRLQPFVAHIVTWPNSTAVASWLDNLQDQLRKADAVVHKCKTQSRVNVIKSIPTSKRLINITTGIRDLLQEAVLAQWSSTLLSSERQNADAAEMKKLLEDSKVCIREVSTDLGKLRSEVNTMELSLVTRKVLNTPTNNYGSSVNTITVPRAFSEIKNQADVTTHHNSNNINQADFIAITHTISDNTSDDEATSSPTAKEQPPLRYPVSEMVFGGDDVVEKLKNILISQEDDLKWVGVWSMGGAGKTLTAQRVYNDSKVQQHFVGGCFWLTVGRERTMLSLLRQLFKYITGRNEKLSEENAKNQVIREMRNREKVLLVLDDVWRSSVLDCLDVIRPSSGSVIFVTTRNVEILDKVFAKKLQIPMLSPDHSWQLFCWHAFHGVNNVLTVLEDVARLVADECKGLPLALKVIGGAMAGKSTRIHWQANLAKLRNADAVSKEHEQQLFLRLQLSVDDLSDIHKHLKDCFYYFAAFPEDASVDMIEDLLGLWAGDDIVGSSNSALPPEYEAYELLGWLIARSLIELHSVNSGTFQKPEYMTCKIHDVLRDLARYNLQHDLEVHQRVCLYQPGRRLTRFPQDWTSHDTSSTKLSAERLSVMFNRLEELPAQLDAPGLRVLLAGHNSQLQSLPQQFLGGLSKLRVLDLRHTGIKQIPAAALGCLELLVLLNLSNCERLENIPDSIKNLKNLKELQLSACPKLKALPGGLRCLTKLETLNLYNTNVWNYEQRGISVMGLDLRWTGAATLRDVSQLTALTNLHVSSPSVGSFPVGLTSLKLLKQLQMWFPELQSFSDINELIYLETFNFLSRKVTILPPGIASLSNLKSLDLSSCIALSCLPALDELPLLEYLSLDGCESLTQLPKSFGRPGAFPSLLELTMHACDRIDVENFPDLYPGAMPQILLLNLSGWTQMRSLPASLQVLTSLRSLNLDICTKLEGLENAFSSPSFRNLEELNLESTPALTRLPPSLALLPKLVKLNLWKCPARHQLPVELQNLGRLQIRT